MNPKSNKMKNTFMLAITLGAILAFYNIGAQETVNYLDEVEISAMRQQRLLRNSPEIIRVITAEEIGRFNYRSTGEVLQQVAGVNIETGTGSGQPKRSTVSLNGYPAQYTLVLVDGNRILSDHIHTGQNIDLIPVESIERIEVITGAASAQYGSDALAGVVNIITKKGSAAPEVLLHAEGGSYNSYRGGVSLQSHVNQNIAVYSYTGWDESDGLPLLFPLHRKGLMNYTHLHNIQKIDATISNNISLGLCSRYTKTTMLWQGKQNQSHLFIPDASLSYTVSKHVKLQAKLAYTNWYSQTNNEHNRLLRPEIWSNIALSKNNQLLAGADFSQAYFTRTAVAGNQQTSWGVFVQNEHKFSKRLQGQISLRADKPENLNLVFSPKLSLLFAATQNLRFRLVTGRGFHAPSLFELYEMGYGHGGTAYRFGNPNLLPEYNTQISAGVEYNIGNNFFANLTGFYSNITNMIVPVYMGPWEMNPIVNVWMRQNIAKANITTGEAAVRWQFLDNYGLYASYTISKNTHIDVSRQLPYQPGSSAGIRLHGSQKLFGNVSIHEYISMKAVYGRSAWNWKPAAGSDQTNPDGFITDLNNYQKIDAGVSLHIANKYEFMLNVYNLLGQDIQNLDDAFTQIDGEVYFNVGFRMLLK